MSGKSPVPEAFRGLLSLGQGADLRPRDLRAGDVFHASGKEGRVIACDRSGISFERRTLDGMKKGHISFAQLAGGVVVRDDTVHVVAAHRVRRGHVARKPAPDQIPLGVLEQRHARLGALIRSRGGEACGTRGQLSLPLSAPTTAKRSEKAPRDEQPETTGTGPWELWITNKVEPKHTWEPPYDRQKRLRSEERPSAREVAKARAVRWAQRVQVMYYDPAASVAVYEHWEKTGGKWKRIRGWEVLRPSERDTKEGFARRVKGLPPIEEEGA